jgi:lysozyme
MPLMTSDAGRKMIEHFEGCILHAYKDIRGVVTIGYGHTNAAGDPRVIMGMTISQDDADKILENDLRSVEKTVIQLVKAPLKQNQFDALVDFQYNTGWLGHPHCSLIAALNRYTAQSKNDTALNYSLAAEDFMLYDYAGGRYVAGLATRRAAERTLFLTGSYPT